MTQVILFQIRSNALKTQIILKDILGLFEKLSSGVFLARETQNLEIALTL